MQEKIKKITEDAKVALEKVKSSAALEELRVRFLGKKGELTEVLRSMGQMAAEERPKVGQMVNDARAELEKVIAACESKLAQAELKARLAFERVDVTEPGRVSVPRGRIHPITQT